MSTTEKATETGYVLATPAVVEGKAVDEVQQAAAPVGRGNGLIGKQGHSCCGGCCDVRRAVIIVNIVNMCLLGMGLFFVLTYFGLANNAENFDDDEVQTALENFDDSAKAVGIGIAILVVKLICNAIGIYGAVSFNIYAVGISLVCYCIDFIMATITLSIGGMLVAAFFAYPHVFFIKEVRAGIMSQENYKLNEEQSCCCV